MNYSRQREEIVHFLKTRKDHPTADVVYENVRKEFPNISLGTVYRNLTLLSDMGELLRLRVGDGMDHFDATTEPHYHFICHGCGRVIDLEMENLDSINGIAGAGFGVDTNVITVITAEADYELELMSKDAAAHEILTVIRDKMA